MPTCQAHTEGGLVNETPSPSPLNYPLTHLQVKNEGLKMLKVVSSPLPFRCFQWQPTNVSCFNLKRSFGVHSPTTIESFPPHPSRYIYGDTQTNKLTKYEGKVYALSWLLHHANDTRLGLYLATHTHTHTHTHTRVCVYIYHFYPSNRYVCELGKDVSALFS